jgi:hypothetical protein
MQSSFSCPAGTMLQRSQEKTKRKHAQAHKVD